MGNAEKAVDALQVLKSLEIALRYPHKTLKSYYPL